MWWCAWGLCAGLLSLENSKDYTGPVYASLLSPGISMFLLLFVSGMPLAEGKALKRYENIPAYWEYRKSTVSRGKRRIDPVIFFFFLHPLKLNLHIAATRYQYALLILGVSELFATAHGRVPRRLSPCRSWSGETCRASCRSYWGSSRCTSTGRQEATGIAQTRRVSEIDDGRWETTRQSKNNWH